MAVAPRTTELVEYDEPTLGDRDVRIRSEFAAPKHGTESHAYWTTSAGWRGGSTPSTASSSRRRAKR